MGQNSGSGYKFNAPVFESITLVLTMPANLYPVHTTTQGEFDSGRVKATENPASREGEQTDQRRRKRGRERDGNRGKKADVWRVYPTTTT